jgi:hypothetical protein
MEVKPVKQVKGTPPLKQEEISFVVLTQPTVDKR